MATDVDISAVHTMGPECFVRSVKPDETPETKPETVAKLLNWPIQSSRSVTNSGLMMFKLFHVVKNMLLHILLHILPHIAVWHWPTGSLWHLQTEISFGFHREAETSPA